MPVRIFDTAHRIHREGDDGARTVNAYVEVFLSTPSVRRATKIPGIDVSHHQFLSTPSVRRATHRGSVPVLVLGISIHTLRAEGDKS